ncbi:peptide chain release factor N(5)-glutamine methyltransferase [Salinisphaera sp.]|uniref:peptide chain release factor N(5)-glutamine methyltransferase n=1 Tax=Salinisphaera sp. TaxID=1914330 RepID=UPI002D782BFB|nr:peptide chain release factor N(5)-glutamine methyltransferase [Salinisphaera sp.]HET7312894.1 peptide chain release factor N(5)-glutamine methyltransferase [Salinisphaera sp.]
MNDSQSPGSIALETLRRDTAIRLAAVSDSPELEARRLLQAIAGLTGARLVIEARRPVDAGLVAHIENAVARRLAGEPLAYIVGRIGFHELELEITPEVLVPRPDTETLVEAVLARLPADAGLHIADLGTGSGAIALALAHARPNWRVLASDAHTGALACARANATRLKLANVAFVLGSWFEPLGDALRFDAIVSNPPYIDPADPHLDHPALRHEPRHALVAADHGLADIQSLAAGAARHLYPGAPLMVEHGHTQGADVRRLFRAAGLMKIETIPDLAGRPRVTLGYARTI